MHEVGVLLHAEQYQLLGAIVQQLLGELPKGAIVGPQDLIHDLALLHAEQVAGGECHFLPGQQPQG